MKSPLTTVLRIKLFQVWLSAKDRCPSPLKSSRQQELLPRLFKICHLTLSYSSYNSRHTVKAVTCVSSNGSIVFSSDLFPGSTFNLAIVDHCLVLQHVNAWDLIVADIYDKLPSAVSLNTPLFLSLTKGTLHQGGDSIMLQDRKNQDSCWESKWAHQKR